MSAQACIIALDVMGGDEGPPPILDGAARAAKDDPSLSFRLHGQAEVLERALQSRSALQEKAQVIAAENVVAMDAKPSQALRRARGTSMLSAIDDVAGDNADAVVSGGNTGALMAMAMMRLRRDQLCDRPAIAALWPRRSGRTVVLDVGANLEATPTMLMEWAVLGEAFCRAVLGTQKPTVGLLNIGQEELKGHSEIRVAAERVRESAPFLNFSGFVEGTGIASGEVDVVVTDGFTGNVALKTAEGTARLVGQFVKDAFQSSLLTKLGAVFAAPALKKLKARMDPSSVNGGVFLGLDKTVVKSHGGADARGVASAIAMAADLARSDFHPETMAALERIHGNATDIQKQKSVHAT